MVLEILLIMAAMLYALFLFFILLMGVYRAKLAGRLSGKLGVLLFPVVVLGVSWDVLCQFTVANLIFLDLPACGLSTKSITFRRRVWTITYPYVEYLVTTRLRRLHSGREGWRKTLAASICDGLLDVFDPSGDHC